MKLLVEEVQRAWNRAWALACCRAKNEPWKQRDEREGKMGAGGTEGRLGMNGHLAYKHGLHGSSILSVRPGFATCKLCDLGPMLSPPQFCHHEIGMSQDLKPNIVRGIIL